MTATHRSSPILRLYKDARGRAEDRGVLNGALNRVPL
jgi:hypothetical protein